MSWLSATEAADIMRCSEQTLIKMAKEGQFPTAKWAGKKVRIHESDLRPEVKAPEPVETPIANPETVRLVSEAIAILEQIIHTEQEMHILKSRHPSLMFRRAS